MTTSRENAPLVELIAELRWDPAIRTDEQIRTAGLGPTFVATQTNALDEFFMRFGAAIHGKGYTETERLVPSGFPIIGHQPVYRFKDKQVGATQSLYQVGAGMFSANAVPPYESWEGFEPVVRKGVEVLLSARSRDEADRPFSATNLRYLDAFRPLHTQGRDVATFLKEVLGISITIPHALSQHLRPGGMMKPLVQLQIPMMDGMLMSVGIGEGAVNREPVIMMDTSVSTTLPVAPAIEAVMKVLNLAHDAIHASFSGLVKPIEHLMPLKTQAAK